LLDFCAIVSCKLKKNINKKNPDCRLFLIVIIPFFYNLLESQKEMKGLDQFYLFLN
jgi:hypothetical protein